MTAASASISVVAPSRTAALSAWASVSILNLSTLEVLVISASNSRVRVATAIFNVLPTSSRAIEVNDALPWTGLCTRRTWLPMARRTRQWRGQMAG